MTANGAPPLATRSVSRIPPWRVLAAFFQNIRLWSENICQWEIKIVSRAFTYILHVCQYYRCRSRFPDVSSLPLWPVVAHCNSSLAPLATQNPDGFQAGIILQGLWSRVDHRCHSSFRASSSGVVQHWLRISNYLQLSNCQLLRGTRWRCRF